MNGAEVDMGDMEIWGGGTRCNPTTKTRGLSPHWLLSKIRSIDKAINTKRPPLLSCNL